VEKKQIRVVALVGSLRRKSYTRSVVNALRDLAPEGMAIEIASIDSVSLYNEDYDGDPPDTWRVLRDQVRSCDAVLFATPEYNRSIPAALKNAIDVGSRPAGASVWRGKPAAVLSVSPGSLGGFGANHHIRQCLTFLDMPVMQQPEAYLSRIATVIDAAGHITASETLEFLRRFVIAFEQWIRRFDKDERSEPRTARVDAALRLPCRQRQPRASHAVIRRGPA
jgi:chromate reductase